MVLNNDIRIQHTYIKHICNCIVFMQQVTKRSFLINGYQQVVHPTDLQKAEN